jgi:hypothetical protein
MTSGKPGTRRRAPTMRHKDIIDRDAPALPVPSPRFVPVIRHEPMRRSTRRERIEEIHIPYREFLHPFNVPDDDLTPEELRARRRKEGRR